MGTEVHESNPTKEVPVDRRYRKQGRIRVVYLPVSSQLEVGDWRVQPKAEEDHSKE